MLRAFLTVSLLTAAAPVDEAALRQAIAETAVAQLNRMDADWNPAQRDCAGLIRYAYRKAFRKLGAPVDALWPDPLGNRAAFADAQTLLQRSFSLLGRGAAVRSSLKSGDLVAFRQGPAEGDEVFHLMMVVRDAGPSHGEAWLVYHPGEEGAGVRAASLDLLGRDSPMEWRPVPENPAFLGFFRFKSFVRTEEVP